MAMVCFRLSGGKYRGRWIRDLKASSNPATLLVLQVTTVSSNQGGLNNVGYSYTRSVNTAQGIITYVKNSMPL